MHQLNESCLTYKAHYQQVNPSGFANKAICAYALKILSQFPKDEKDLSKFLQDNWKLVQSSLLSPTAIPNEPITIFLGEVAKHLNPRDPLSQLMPGIAVDSVSDSFSHLRHLNANDVKELRDIFLKCSRLLEGFQFNKEALSPDEQKEIELLDEKLESSFNFLDSSLNDIAPITKQQLDEFRGIIEASLKITHKHLQSYQNQPKADESLNEYLARIKFKLTSDQTKQIKDIQSAQELVAKTLDDLTQKEIELKTQIQTFLLRFSSPYPELSTILQTHILSDDAKTLIPVGILSAEKFGGINPYSEDYQQLSSSEMHRIHEHSDLTRELYQAQINLNDLSLYAKNDLYSQLIRLCLVLKINDAHGGRGVQEQVGEQAFTALVHFHQYYQLLSDEQKSKIPQNVKTAIDKLLDVASPEENARWKNMQDRIETCAGSRREQIEHAMLGNTQALMQISISSDKSQLELINAQKNLDSLKEQLKKQLDKGTYQKGHDELGFKKSLLGQINLEYHIKTIEDLNELKKLSPDNLTELLKDNPNLQKEILSKLKSIDNLVSFTSGISYENLSIIFKYLGNQLKSLIKNNLEFFELMMHHNDFNKLRLLAWYLDLGHEILKTGKPQITVALQEIRALKKLYKNPNQDRLDLIFKALTVSEDSVDKIMHEDLETLCLAWIVAKKHDNEKLAQQLLTEIEKNPQGFKKVLQNAIVIGEDTTVEQLLFNEKMDYAAQMPLHLAIKEGRTALFLKLINHEKLDINAVNSKNQTALHIAAEVGFQLSNLLLQHPDIKINHQDSFGNTPLMSAALTGQEVIVEQLLATRKIDINLKNQRGFSALSIAAGGGYDIIIQKLLLYPGIDDSNAVALELAVLENHCKAAQLLLEKLNYPQDILESLCKKAINLGNPTLAFLLLEKIKDKSKQDELLIDTNELVLKNAAKAGDFDWFLKAYGNLKGNEEYRIIKIKQALFLALSHERLGMVKDLMNHFSQYIDFQTTDQDGLSLIEKAASIGDAVIIQELLNYQLPEEQIKKALKLGIDHEKDLVIQVFLEKSKMDAELLDYFCKKYRFKALSIVIKAGRIDLLEQLLQRKDLEIDKDLKLHFLVWDAIVRQRDIAIISMLIKQESAKLSQIYSDGDTLLHKLADFIVKDKQHVNSHTRKVFILLLKENKVDLSIVNNVGKTVLDYILEKKDKELILLILKHYNALTDEVIDSLCSRLDDVLTVAIKSGNKQLVLKVMNHLFGDKKLSSKLFNEYLHTAVIVANKDIVEIILSRLPTDEISKPHSLANVFGLTKGNKDSAIAIQLIETLELSKSVPRHIWSKMLTHAIQSKMTEVVPKLLNMKNVLDAPKSEMENFLHVAIKEKFPIDDLIKHPKVDVNLTSESEDGFTALHLAIKYAYPRSKPGNLDLAFQLITQTHIDLTKEDAYGKTAFDYIPERYQEQFFLDLNKKIEESCQSLRFKSMITSSLPSKASIALLKSNNGKSLELYQRLVGVQQLMEKNPKVSEKDLLIQISDYLTKSLSFALKMSLWIDNIFFSFGISDKKNELNEFIDSVNQERNKYQ